MLEIYFKLYLLMLSKSQHIRKEIENKNKLLLFVLQKKISFQFTENVIFRISQSLENPSKLFLGDLKVLKILLGF